MTAVYKYYIISLRICFDASCILLFLPPHAFSSDADDLYFYLYFFFFFNVARQVYHSLLKHEVLKFHTDENASVALCLWRDEFRFSSAILLTAGSSLNETPHIAGIYFFFSV